MGSIPRPYHLEDTPLPRHRRGGPPCPPLPTSATINREDIAQRAPGPPLRNAGDTVDCPRVLGGEVAVGDVCRDRAGVALIRRAVAATAGGFDDQAVAF